MTDPNDRAAIDSVRNDAEFPDDERGLTGVDEREFLDPGAPEGQTARDIIREDDGVPGIADDDDPTMRTAEDPQFAPEPGDRDTHRTQDYGTTAFEQSEGESLSGRLGREVPDVGGQDAVRAAGTHDRTVPQLDQDVDTDPSDDSGTDSVGDDVLATGEDATGGAGPEDRAMHVTDG